MYARRRGESQAMCANNVPGTFHLLTGCTVNAASLIWNSRFFPANGTGAEHAGKRSRRLELMARYALGLDAIRRVALGLFDLCECYRRGGAFRFNETHLAAIAFFCPRGSG
jgi:hypothetical protein